MYKSLNPERAQNKVPPVAGLSVRATAAALVFRKMLGSKLSKPGEDLSTLRVEQPKGTHFRGKPILIGRGRRCCLPPKGFHLVPTQTNCAGVNQP